MDIPTTGRTPLIDIARTYLLAQGVYAPKLSEMQELVDAIRTLNAGKVSGNFTKTGPSVIRIPDAVGPTIMKLGGEALSVMGLPSQYRLGKRVQQTLDHGVMTIHYEQGLIVLHSGKVLEVQVGTTTIPGDVVERCRRHGTFSNASVASSGSMFFNYRFGYAELYDQDDREPPLDIKQRNGWTHRTLTLDLRGKVFTVYSFDKGDVVCRSGRDHFPVCSQY